MPPPRLDADGLLGLIAAIGRLIWSAVEGLANATYDWGALKLLLLVAMFGGGWLLIALWRPLPSGVGALLVALSLVWAWFEISSFVNKKR